MKTFKYGSAPHGKIEHHQCTTMGSSTSWCYYMWHGSKYWDYCPDSCKLNGWFFILSLIIIKHDNLKRFENMCVILCLTFQAKNVHGSVTNVDMESQNPARDGAQCIIIVGTLILIRNMELTAQDVPKVLHIKTFLR